MGEFFKEEIIRIKIDYNDIIKQKIVGAILSLEGMSIMQRVEKLSPNAIKT